MENPHHHVLSKKQKRQAQQDRLDADARMRRYMDQTRDRFAKALEMGKDFEGHGVLAGPTKKASLGGFGL